MKQGFYVCSGGTVMIHRDKMVLTKQEAEALYRMVANSGVEILKSPQNEQERLEAVEFLKNMQIIPYQVH